MPDNSYMNVEARRSPKSKVDPKLSQFTEELTELCERYQYTLSPQLSFTADGITPTLGIVNKIPLKKIKTLEHIKDKKE